MKRLIIITITVLSLLLVTSVIINAVLIRNFETARTLHVQSVKNAMLGLGNGFYRAAWGDFDTHPEQREVRLAQLQGYMLNLGTAQYGLAVHHNFRASAGGTNFPHFRLGIIAQQVLRYDEDPIPSLQFLAYQILQLHDSIVPYMSTYDLFGLINETSQQINTHFGFRW